MTRPAHATDINNREHIFIHFSLSSFPVRTFTRCDSLEEVRHEVAEEDVKIQERVMSELEYSENIVSTGTDGTISPSSVHSSIVNSCVNSCKDTLTTCTSAILSSVVTISSAPSSNQVNNKVNDISSNNNNDKSDNVDHVTSVTSGSSVASTSMALPLPMNNNTSTSTSSSKYVTPASSAGISFNSVNQSVTLPMRSTGTTTSIHHNLTSPPVGFNQYYYPFGTYHSAGATIAAAAVAAAAAAAASSSSTSGGNVPSAAHFSHVHHGPGPSHAVNSSSSIHSLSAVDPGSGVRSPDLPATEGELDYVPHFQRVYITGAENSLSGVSLFPASFLSSSMNTLKLNFFPSPSFICMY